MAFRAPNWALFAAILLPASTLPSQVFVVGERTATELVSTDFKPTSVELPPTRISERGRRELERMLVAEQGFAHRALPLGSGLSLQANGPMTPAGDKYRHMLFEKGQSAAAGDRVIVTALLVKPDRLIVDVNGGPFAKHRFLSHIQLNNGNVVAPQEQATGARVTLLFPDGTPDLSAPEVKALLEPVIDFGVKSSEQAYADTLPPPLRDAIAAHEVLVGMNRRMVIAALGQPDSKVRERSGEDANGARYEEWIYGHVPQTVRFVRFTGDRVAQLEIAELGKPLQIRVKDEVGGFSAPAPTREIQMGDVAADRGKEGPVAPTLRRPDEPVAPSTDGKVQMPDNPDKKPPTKLTPAPSQLLSAAGAGNSADVN